MVRGDARTLASLTSGRSRNLAVTCGFAQVRTVMTLQVTARRIVGPAEGVNGRSA